MLLKSIIRKTLKINRHVVKDIKEMDGEIIISLEIRRGWRQPCGTCQSMGKVRDRLKKRRWKHVNLWGIAVFLEYAPARVCCPTCEKIKVEAIPWSLGKCQLTSGLVWTLSEFCKLLPWSTVAQMFGVHWNTVAAAVRAAVSYGLEHRKTSDLLYIGIDELSRRKGHVYVTNVYDLKGKRLLWSGEGRTNETLRTFFEEFGTDIANQVKGVCCDMWQPYINMVKEYLPHATLVFDKFHIVAKLLEAVDEVRRDEVRELKHINPDLLKRSRYIWLKNPENLKDKERARLGYLEKLNVKCHRAWLLKESFRELWEYRDRAGAHAYLKQWFWWATHSRLEPMRDFAWMTRRHQEEILNYSQLPITNGAVEGLNNKAKVVSHRSYGFRTSKNYITALYHCLGKLPRPPQMHKFL